MLEWLHLIITAVDLCSRNVPRCTGADSLERVQCSVWPVRIDQLSVEGALSGDDQCMSAVQCTCTAMVSAAAQLDLKESSALLDLKRFQVRIGIPEQSFNCCCQEWKLQVTEAFMLLAGNISYSRARNALDIIPASFDSPMSKHRQYSFTCLITARSLLGHSTKSVSDFCPHGQSWCFIHDVSVRMPFLSPTLDNHSVKLTIWEDCDHIYSPVSELLEMHKFARGYI